MDFPEENMIDKWLEENHNPEIEIQVLNEVVDKLVEERDTLLKQRDEFAIDFGRWLNENDRACSYAELLEIFKKEKGL